MNDVGRKPYDSGLMANDEVAKKPAMVVMHKPIMATPESHRSRRSYNPEVQRRLRKKVKGADSPTDLYKHVNVPSISEEQSFAPRSDDISGTFEVPDPGSFEASDESQENNDQTSLPTEDDLETFRNDTIKESSDENNSPMQHA